MSLMSIEPVRRHIPLPNGSKIVGVRESTLRAGVSAANAVLKADRLAAQTAAFGAVIKEDHVTLQALAKV